MDNKKIIIVGHIGSGKATLTAIELAKIKKKFGDDIIIMSHDEAIEKELLPKPMELKVEMSPIIPIVPFIKGIPVINKKANQRNQRREWSKSNHIYNNKFSKRR
jgi:CO dehydrogenase nickel-insertion accessory protein CooC1